MKSSTQTNVAKINPPPGMVSRITKRTPSATLHPPQLSEPCLPLPTELDELDELNELDELEKLSLSSSKNVSPTLLESKIESSNATTKYCTLEDDVVCVLLEGHTGGVQSVAFSPDSKRLVSGGDLDNMNSITNRGNEVRIWDLTCASGPEIVKSMNPETKSVHKSWLRSVAFSRDGKYIVAGCQGSGLVWDVESGELVVVLEHRRQKMTKCMISIAFSPHTDEIVSLSDPNRNEMHVFNIWNNNFRQSRNTKTTRKGNVLYVQTKDRLDMAKDKVFFSINCFAFSPNGKKVVTGEEETMRLWDFEKRRSIKTLKISRENNQWYISSVAFSKAADSVVFGLGNTLRVWDLATETVNILGSHNADVTSVAFSSNDQCIVSGSKDMTVCLWEFPSGKLMKTLKGHTETVNSVAFSPDGLLVASGSTDSTVRLWHVASSRSL